MIASFKKGKLLPLKDSAVAHKRLHGAAKLFVWQGSLKRRGPGQDAWKLAIDAFDILVKEKTLGRVSVPEGKKAPLGLGPAWCGPPRGRPVSLGGVACSQ